MTEHVLLDTEYATVRYDDEHEFIYHTFHQPIGGEHFRTTLNTGLDTLVKHKAVKWLSDDRKNAEFAPEDAQFAITDWGPRAAKGGWKFWALVVPESLAGRDSMQGIVQTFFDLGVQVRIFSDPDTARDWLIKQ